MVFFVHSKVSPELYILRYQLIDLIAKTFINYCLDRLVPKLNNDPERNENRIASGNKTTKLQSGDELFSSLL